MDDLDLTIQREQDLLNALVQVRKPDGPKPTGKCLWCEEPFDISHQRWCDADCRNDYMKAMQNAPHLIP